MPTRVVVDDDEQIIADLQKDMRRLRSRLATTSPHGGHDAWTAAATPATTYQLSVIPVQGTCEFAINGHEQREGTDYTCDYDTGLVTVSASLSSGDKLVARYLVTDWLVARSLPPENDTTIGKYGILSNKAVKVGSGSLAVFLSVPSQTNDISVDTSGLANSAQYITIYCLGDAHGYLGVQVHSGTLYVVTDYAGIGPTFGTSYSYGSAFPATLRATYDPTTGVCNAYLAGTLRSTLTLDATRRAAWTAPYIVGISNDDAANAVTFDNLSVNGTITDSFNRPDANYLGFTDTGQEWTG